jgi:hypothetical protein
VLFTLIPAAGILGGIIGFFVSTGRVLRKFDRLEPDVKKKLFVLNPYMAVARNLSKEDLLLLSTLPVKELKRFNKIHDYAERIQTIREKIKR